MSPRCRKVILAASNSLGCGSCRSVKSRQQFGDVVAGIQGRKIAAKRWKPFDGRGLSQQFERLARFREDHNIGNAQQVKATLERRLEPPRPLGEHRNLAQIAREQRRHRRWSRRPPRFAAPELGFESPAQMFTPRQSLASQPDHPRREIDDVDSNIREARAAVIRSVAATESTEGRRSADSRRRSITRSAAGSWPHSLLPSNRHTRTGEEARGRYKAPVRPGGRRPSPGQSRRPSRWK